MKYVIKKERLANYLFNLGYNYRKVPDKTLKLEYVYLFENSDDLQESITYYTKIKNKQKLKLKL